VKGCCFTGDFGRKDFNLSGGFIYWGNQEICKKKRPWKTATLSIGAPLGNLEEGSFTGDFERQ